ncbi:MAG: mechanosensitive ion channel family protein [Candidatus Pacebacteria bacterium]|nr:mechanosensitive ion channel family protein [Candidatus Paceibacterota bacterium]
MINEIIQGIKSLEAFFPFFIVLLIAFGVYLLFGLGLRASKRALLQKAKTKKQIASIEAFSRIFKYAFLFLIIILISFYYSKSWTGLGLSIGLLSAALGWALQKPITGIAAWLMVVLKRPFSIGDRVIIGSVKGDVSDITLTHIYLKEVGGIILGEENSGRVIMVPNSILFEQNITNYNLQYEYVLDQVVLAITYESDLKEAVAICKEAVKVVKDRYFGAITKEAYIRNSFQTSGVNVSVRYLVLANRLQEISSYVTEEIFERVKNSQKVKFAYPHTEVVMKQNLK